MTDPSRVVKPLFYNNTTVYGYNIGPNDTHQYYGLSGNRLETVVEYWRKTLLKYLAPYAKYSLITETSEPVESRKDTGYSRIHFHGYIQFKNSIRYRTEALHKLAGQASIVIHPLDEEYWQEYIAKQKSQMSPELGDAYYLSDKDTVTTPFGYRPLPFRRSTEANEVPEVTETRSAALRSDDRNVARPVGPIIHRHGVGYPFGNI